VNKYAELVYKNVTHINGFHMAHEQIIDTTEGAPGSYYTGHLQLTVSDKDLNSSLVQLDAVENGYVEGGEEILELVFGDMRAEVVPVSEVEQSLLQVNQYLHNKVQEQARSIAMLEGQFEKLMEVVTGDTAKVAGLQARYDGMQGYLLNVVDLPALVKIVRRLAEEVDEDILDEASEVVKVH
jgi:hypothetical protein